MAPMEGGNKKTGKKQEYRNGFIKSSILLPFVFTKANWPPTTFELPGPIMAEVIPARMKIAFGENPKVNFSGQGKMPVTRMAIAGMLREELFKAKQYIEKRKKAEKEGEGFEKDFRYECWIPVFEGKIPLKAHVHRVDDIFTAIPAQSWRK